jgi:uncharacterized protein YciI
MQFAWIGFMRDGVEASPTVLREVTGFLEQPYIRIPSAGSLHDNAGRRAGMMMIFEAQDHAAAEALVAESPFLKANLYERHHLFEYRDEVG